MTTSASKSPTIGVFDSGFGGLTVLRALLPLIPAAHYLYLGDTARLPYGSKSRETIARYAVESARFLADHGADLLVIACNTATALAMPEIRAAVSIPVIGVIEPAVEMAHLGRQHSEVLVLATQATTQSHAYFEACARRALKAVEKACPLLVPLVEEGWVDHPVTRDVLRIYLSEALQDCTPSAVLLGCTHYPLISGAIEQTLRLLGSQATIIDSAHSTAQMTALHFGQSSVDTVTAAVTTANATFECYATDSVEKFARLGSQFLGQPIPHVHLLDLGG
jgi:glutamate racemase